MIGIEEVMKEYEESARGLSRKYGVDPLTVIVELERKEEIKRNLMILLRELNEIQQQILLMTVLGYNTRTIAKELNRSASTIVGSRQSIGRKLLEVADEKRLKELKDQVTAWRGRRREGRRYQKTLKEYKRRKEVREAMKKLYDAMIPLERSTNNKQYVTRPTLLFERLRRRSRVRECRLSEYLEMSFGDKNTKCPLCQKCTEK